MKLKKNTTKLLAASVITGTVLGVGIPSATGTADAAAESGIFSELTNPKAAQNLNDIYDEAFNGEMPGLVHGLKVDKSTKDDVHAQIGTPEEPAAKDDPFDRYHGSMGEPSYAITYHKDKTVAEIRNFGPQVERQQNLGGITPAVLNEQLGSADQILAVPNTNEMDYVYQTDDYELHFVVGNDQKVDHVNLKAAE